MRASARAIIATQNAHRCGLLSIAGFLPQAQKNMAQCCRPESVRPIECASAQITALCVRKYWTLAARSTTCTHARTQGDMRPIGLNGITPMDLCAAPGTADVVRESEQSECLPSVVCALRPYSSGTSYYFFFFFHSFIHFLFSSLAVFGGCWF